MGLGEPRGGAGKAQAGGMEQGKREAGPRRCTRSPRPCAASEDPELAAGDRGARTGCFGSPYVSRPPWTGWPLAPTWSEPKALYSPQARSIFTRSLPVSPAGGVNKKAAREGAAARTPGTNACNSQMAREAVLPSDC